MPYTRRRVVKRAMTRDKATEVRRQIEDAQRTVLKEPKTALPASVGWRVEQARAQQTLDRYGVTAYETVTQSRHRVLRYWRVYAGS